MPAFLPTFSREREREVPSNNGYLLVITAARTTKVKTASVTDCCHLPIQKTGVFNGPWPTKLSIIFSFSVVKTTKLKQHARYLLFFLMPPANSKNWSFQWPLANETQHFVQLLCCQDNKVKQACVTDCMSFCSAVSFLIQSFTGLYCGKLANSIANKKKSHDTISLFKICLILVLFVLTYCDV